MKNVRGLTYPVWSVTHSAKKTCRYCVHNNDMTDFYVQIFGTAFIMEEVGNLIRRSRIQISPRLHTYTYNVNTGCVHRI